MEKNTVIQTLDHSVVNTPATSTWLKRKRMTWWRKCTGDHSTGKFAVQKEGQT